MSHVVTFQKVRLFIEIHHQCWPCHVTGNLEKLGGGCTKNSYTVYIMFYIIYIYSIFMYLHICPFSGNWEADWKWPPEHELIDVMDEQLMKLAISGNKYELLGLARTNKTFPSGGWAIAELYFSTETAPRKCNSLRVNPFGQQACTSCQL